MSDVFQRRLAETADATEALLGRLLAPEPAEGEIARPKRSWSILTVAEYW